jgi:iron complex transport system permease protein
MDYLIQRALCAILAGTILSQTGSLIQMSSRNVLASPSTLGFDGLSILWILIFHSLLLYFGMDLGNVWVFIAGAPVFLLVGRTYASFMRKGQKIEKLIFIGLAFNLLVGTVFSLWQFLFLAFNLPFPVELWFGHFRYADQYSLLILLLTEVLILAGWLLLKKEFAIFSLGRSVAMNLKLKQRLLYLYLFMAIAVGTFAVISIFGAFSFLGLIFPLVARKFWFKSFDLNGEFIVGGITNGIFLMIIDSLCYHFPIYGAEIPVGLIATGVGALSLILLLWKSDRRFEILANTKK